MFDGSVEELSVVGGQWVGGIPVDWSVVSGSVLIMSVGRRSVGRWKSCW